MSLLLFLLGCDPSPVQPPPTLSLETTTAGQVDEVLPPSVLDLDRARGEMLRFDQVEGFRARRLDYSGNLGLILQGDPRDKSNQREALSLAETPALVLLVSPETDLGATTDYMLGVKGIEHVEVRNLENVTP